MLVFLCESIAHIGSEGIQCILRLYSLRSLGVVSVLPYVLNLIKIPVCYQKKRFDTLKAPTHYPGVTCIFIVLPVKYPFVTFITRYGKFRQGNRIDQQIGPTSDC